MPLAKIILAITAILNACVCAAELDGPYPKGKQSTRSSQGRQLMPKLGTPKRAGNASEPTLDPQVLSDLSTWFGWQLAGAAKDTNDLSEPCTNIDSTGGQRWAQIGLVPANIQAPLCNASHGPPNPEVAFPASIPAISAIIERQLVGSFTGNESFAYLCDHLAGFQIDQFYLTATKLLKAVCDKAGKQVPPRPFSSGEPRHLSEAAAFAARNTASILYATLLAAGAESGLRINVLCAHAPNHIENLNTEKLNGTLVQSRLCSFKGPIPIGQARTQILSWTSRLFITVLENIGEGDDWLKWLCVNLHVEKMNKVGLIGWSGKQQVCEDEANGLPTDLVLPEGIPYNGTTRF